MVVIMKNPPAFPLHNHGTQSLGLHFTGMTLRDYFAAQALQGYLACKGWHPEFYQDFPQEFASRGKTKDILPNVCYQMADAMLKAREA
jgi:hypothetical protein